MSDQPLDPQGVDDTIISKESAVPVDPEDAKRVCDEVPGRYDLATGPDASVQELGRGGIGRVVVAVDRFVGREVAMKQLLTELASDPKLGATTSTRIEQRFLREARLTGQLEHPAIVPVYEIGRRADGSLYYTMARIRGRTLYEAIHTATSLEGRLLLMPAVLTVCQAIASAHARGVIHRDIKPQNVMLGRFGVTCVLDWGLARAKSASSDVRMAPEVTDALDGTAVGTPSYMSPEQALGRQAEIDERSDVWGLGALLYEVLTGQVVYPGKSPWDVIAAIRTEPWKPVRAVVPRAPADLVAICEKALQKKPADRYQSAADMAADLEAWLQGKCVAAYEYSTLEVVTRFVRRQKLVVAVVAAALVALATLGTVSWVHIKEERNASREFAALITRDVGNRLRTVPGARATIESMWRKVIAYYTRLSAWSSLSLDEQDQLVIAWLKLGDLQRTNGQLVEARASYEACVRLAPLEPLPERATPASLAVSCRYSLAFLDRAEGKKEEHARRIEALAAVVGPLEPRYETADWKSSLAEVFGLLGTVALDAGDDTAYEKHVRHALALEEDAVRLSPDDLSLRRNVVMSLRDAELAVFSFRDPVPGLELGRRALEYARPLTTSADYRSLIAMGSALRQHGAILAWLPGREAESRELLAEATRTLEQANAMEPNDVAALGELGDTYLELGRAEDAIRVLNKADILGMKGEYEVSFGLAELLAGKLGSAKKRLAPTTDDFQALWIVAMATVLEPDGDDAAALLRAAGKLSDGPTQWPRGAVVALTKRYTSPRARIAEQLVADYEVAFVREEPAEMQAAFDKAAAALEALPKR